MSDQPNAMLEEKIENLAGQVGDYIARNDKAMDEIKGLLRGMSESLTKVLNTDADRAVRLAQLEEWKRNMEQAMVASKDDRAQLWRKIDKAQSDVERLQTDMQGKIDKLQTDMQGKIDLLKSRLGYVIGVGTVVGTALILWVANQLLGLIHP